MKDKDKWTISNRKYAGRKILAPMVRTGTLPMRLLALDYGADLVYCEELIDFKLLRSIRKVNDALGTIDYIDQTDGTVVFRTCAREKDNVILQLGTNDPDRALSVAKLMQGDVSGIDINMGCPKEFSIKGGMGAALLSQPDKAVAILEKLVSNVDIPVTCKVRVLDKTEDTVALCRQLESTGISAIGVHGRTRDERPQHPNRNNVLRVVSQALHIPVIANGGSKEVENYEDIEKFREATGCDSVMLARAAQGNCSIFRRDGKLPLDDVIVAYLRYCVDYDNSPANTKYNVQNMLKEQQETARGKQFLETQTLEQISAIWGLGEYCRERHRCLREKGLITRRDVTPALLDDRLLKRPRLEETFDDGVTRLSCAFLRSCFQSDVDLPKTRLLMWTRKARVPQPRYSTLQLDKLFQSVVTVAGKQYSSTCWEKNKRWAEQGAAIVCLVTLGLVDKEPLLEAGCLL